MAQKTVAPYATTDLLVPYGQKIAISTNGGDYVTIWYRTAVNASPAGWYVHDNINNEEVLLGTFTADQNVRIETQGSPALYDIGTSPSVGTGDASTLNGYVQDSSDTPDTIALRDSNGDIQANAFESTVATGTAPLTVASTTKVANLNADLLDDLNSATASTASTIAARDASGDLTANVLISDVAIGTPPLTVTSTTVVTNLNSDQTDGYNAAEAATAGTLAARDASGDIAANAFASSVATGTAPLTVASTTKVANLNADLLDDMNTATASTATTVAARDASGDLTANVLISDVAGGTAPLTITSTTVVPNLNVDQTDGYDADETDTGSTLAARDASGDIQANAFESTVATGTTPITVASTTKVANLNADLLDDMNTATASTATTVAARDGSGNLTANVLVSDVAGGTAPLTVTSNTVVTNLNADLLDGQEGSYYEGLVTTAVSGTTSYLSKFTGANAVGNSVLYEDSSKIGINTATPGSYNANADDLVTYSSGNTGLTVVSDSAGTGAFYFADGTGASSAMGGIHYNHSTDLLSIRVNNDVKKTIDSSGNVLINNNVFYESKESGGTARDLLGLDGSNVAQIGNTNNATNIQSNGTLTYNAASLASGTIDTTATQTITVVDGLITSIV